MKEGTLICDFSGAYAAQGFLPWVEENGSGVEVLSFKELEGTSCYCDPEAAPAIGKMLPAALPGLRWIDSGDYHYMTHLLALRETEPFHLLLLDNHPDNQEPAFGGVLSCGSWVKAMREENPLLRTGVPTKKGTIERVDYTTSVYEDGKVYPKYCYVYLPYGYDAEDKFKKYNVLYYQHIT